MAISATMAVDNSVVYGGQRVLVTFTLTNPAGGTTAQVLRVEPYVLCASTTPPAAEEGTPALNIGASTLVTGSSSVNSTWSNQWYMQLYAPQKPGASPLTYTVGAVAYLSDGTAPSASTSVYVYPRTSDGLTTTAMPTAGSFRLDSNIESGMIAALMYPH